ncbi:RagB/SusD family nutrient uptake outer membrane protein [Sediminibacterium soli]|uniref:RagB/SusD family nutrient uptake outer membrane protein n=1 Tax=Sediminibacterium soli TaxID=2698829 RepID=UPI001379E707|nr:RagB/SusD family nutrient uptake outer membrane protein [Sediminibacterium soli]NCI45297.1 RagB/SusD family nutrient uptake outer membrane protein [Sediminibacterium soli]
MKRYQFFNILLAAGLMLTASCKKTFLDENLTTARGMDFYKTEAGIQSLATGTYYYVFNTPFNGEWTFCNTNYGTDEFHVGGDASNGVWNAYDAGLRSIIPALNGNTISANVQWDNAYIGIGYANLLIQNASTSTSTSDAVKKVALGEGYFFRAYNYLRLVSQYGGVPLKTKPSTGIELEFTRAAAKDVYAQVIADFQSAYNLLANTGGPSRITKDAAAHYLAKAYLFRASEVNDSWNASTKTADLQAIVPLCDAVIANHPLAPDFGDLWKYTGPDAPNEKLSELILSAQFTSDVSASGANTQHLYYIGRYDDLPYMQRDISGDRPYSRLATTYYMYRIYDMVNDSRFWKSFKTKHRLNKASGAYVNGDLGIMYVVNQPGDNRYAKMKLNDVVVYGRTGKTIPNVYVAYPAGATADGAMFADVRFPSLSKFMDGSRIALNETRGLRDVVLARSAETYLIAAEARIRLANAGVGAYADALPYINAVRARGQYRSGEDRSLYADGGGAYTASASGQSPAINSYYPENSYYESNNIPVTTAASTSLAVTNTATLPAGDEYVISKLGYATPYDRMLCFLLNERSRELCGEFKRWEDLARTKTLLARARAFNPEAAPNIKDFHMLRPIPQTYLDGIQASGAALTSDQKQAQQNPGY